MAVSPCGFGAWAKLHAGLRRFGMLATLRGACRLGLMRILRSPDGIAAVVRDGLSFRFRMPVQCPTALVLYGDLVEPEYEFVRRVVVRGSVFFDVGAGIGTFALVAARHGARVHAFEPHAGNAATIAANLERNRLGDLVTLQPVAVSDRSGAAELRTGRSWFDTEVVAVRDCAAPATVPAVTLDEFCRCRSIEAIDVLKVDVEGHEHRVLTGAARLLREQRIGAVIVEAGRSYAACRALLEAAGYELFYYLPEYNGLLRMSAVDHRDLAICRPSGFHCNVVAAPRLGRGVRERVQVLAADALAAAGSAPAPG
jgi:FkbM family methyltransferase